MRALIVDDDLDSREALEAFVIAEGFETRTAGSVAEARIEIERELPEIALVDLSLPDGSGMEVFEILRSLGALDVVLITGNASVESAVHALRQGVSDYLTKPVDIARLRAILVNLARTRELKAEVESLRVALLELGRFGPLIGASPAMRDVYALIARVAPSDVPVLIVGETGTGKELAAQAIHGASPRRDRPLIALNCSAVSATLVESQLFGHEKGSFTGAINRHRGVFEQAAGGTLFLDELTEMPIELQAKLLRALEGGSLARVGGEETIHVDVRLVAATNRSPEQAIAEGKLRQDLFYRLAAFPISLPPLSARNGDVELLAEAFLADLNRAGKTHKRFAPETFEHLRRYAWPGNVRELRNVVQRCFLLVDHELEPACLPDHIRASPDGAVGGTGGGGAMLSVRVGTALAEVERRLTLATLDQCEGDKKRAAEMLGMSLKTLYNRLNAWAKSA